MAAIDEFGIDTGDDDLREDSERFVAEKRKYRVSMAAWPGLEEGKLDLTAKTPRFKKCKRHYIKGVGMVLNKGPEYTKLAGSAPSTHIATVIVVWPTDEKGMIDKIVFNALKEDPEEYASKVRVCPWIFGKDKYRDLVSVHTEFHLGEVDVTLNCTETQYQRMSVQPGKGSLFKQIMESDKPKTRKLWDSILTRIQQAWDKIDSEFGMSLTLDQFREKMGGDSVPMVEAAASDEEIDDMIGDLTL